VSEKKKQKGSVWILIFSIFGFVAVGEEVWRLCFEEATRHHHHLFGGLGFGAHWAWVVGLTYIGLTLGLCGMAADTYLKDR